MKRKKTTNEKPTKDTHPKRSETPLSARANSDPFLLIHGEDGRVVGLITDPEICKTRATRKIDFQLIMVPSDSSERILPCVTNKKLQAELKSMLATPEIQVAGGIVRHSIR